MYSTHKYGKSVVKERVIRLFKNKIYKYYQKEFRIENVIKRKGNKLHVKWKGNNNLFSSWIDKKDTV